MFLVLIYVGRVNKTNISKGKSYMPKKTYEEEKNIYKRGERIEIKTFLGVYFVCGLCADSVSSLSS